MILKNYTSIDYRIFIKLILKGKKGKLSPNVKITVYTFKTEMDMLHSFKGPYRISLMLKGNKSFL